MAKRTGGFIGQDGLNAPDPATGVSASGGDTQATVSFTAPSDVGGSAITGYRVQDSTGAFGASGSASPIAVTGLTNGTSYTFNVWAINPFGWSTASDASGSVSPLAARALFFGGQGPSSDTDLNVIDYVAISTTGNAIDFGDIGATAGFTSACGSASRSLVSTMRYGGSTSNVIEYVTPTSAGNALDFGDLTVARFWGAGASNSTRGLFAGGSGTNVIDYVTIASTGNATDFGDLTNSVSAMGSAASPTRAIFAGGGTNVIQYVTIASTGNASDFGDLSEAQGDAGCSSSTRALFGNVNGKIEYITIASTGNATIFGELSVGNTVTDQMAASSEVRGLFAGGKVGGEGYNNRIQYFTISTTGNSTDFGDLTISRNRGAGTSTAHGGLS